MREVVRKPKQEPEEKPENKVGSLAWFKAEMLKKQTERNHSSGNNRPRK